MIPRLSSIITPKSKVLAVDEAGDLEHRGDKDAGAFRTSSLSNWQLMGPLNLELLVQSVDREMRAPELFFQAAPTSIKAEWGVKSIRFSASDGRDFVEAEIYGNPRGISATILVPHWNAEPGSYKTMARLLSLKGLTIFVVTLPFHGFRGHGPIANGFLNADLGATINSVRQAVIEVRALTQLIKNRGFSAVSYLGISLGSCVAALAAAFEPEVERVALLLTAGDFAETVWTGTATCHIKLALEGHISLPELKRAWRIISPVSFLPLFAASKIPILLLLGEYDRVVVYRLGLKFADSLREAGADVRVAHLRCGHYSLAVFPFNILALISIAKFMTKPPASTVQMSATKIAKRPPSW